MERDTLYLTALKSNQHIHFNNNLITLFVATEREGDKNDDDDRFPASSG